VEAALWTSLRLIEERVQLMRQLAERFRAQPRTSSSFLAKAGELEREAAALRPIVEGVAQAVTVAIGDDG
jgi:hypothetical protein